MPDAPAALAEVTQGPLAESVHWGHVAAVTGAGHLALGDPDQVVYLRSSTKPVQAFPRAGERGPGGSARADGRSG